MLTLHIGPPKTATSSLQAAIQDCCPERIAYFGVQQPRIDFSRVIETPLRYCAETIYLKCAYPDLVLSKVELLTTIQNQLAHGKTGCISEEMFLTDHPEGVKWQEKIKRLGSLLRHHSATPLITLRHPLHATQSLYRELFTSLPSIFKCFPSLFIFSNAARVYDYRYVLKTLALAGFEEVRIIDFDKLCAGQVTLMDLFGLPSGEPLSIPHRNQASIDKVMEVKTKRFARPPCSWILGPRVKHYRSLQALVAENREDAMRITTLIKNI